VTSVTQSPPPVATLVGGMTLARLISPTLRSALLLAVGTVLLLGPALLELSAAALVTGVAVGALATALGISGTGTEGPGTLPMSAHAAYDRLLALGLLVAAVIFGLTGDRSALLFFGASGLATLLMASTTSYSVSRA
jgi:hypothetical protein